MPSIIETQFLKAGLGVLDQVDFQVARDLGRATAKPNPLIGISSRDWQALIPFLDAAGQRVLVAQGDLPVEVSGVDLQFRQATDGGTVATYAYSAHTVGSGCNVTLALHNSSPKHVCVKVELSLAQASPAATFRLTEADHGLLLGCNDWALLPIDKDELSADCAVVVTVWEAEYKATNPPAEVSTYGWRVVDPARPLQTLVFARDPQPLASSP